MKNAVDGPVDPVRLMADTYSVNIEKEEVFSDSCNVPAKDRERVLILHYLARKAKGLPGVSGDWVSFRQLEGGDGYYPAFKKRVLDRIARKHGTKPETLLDVVERFRAKRAQVGDVSVVLEPFDGIPVLVTLQRGDDEFGPEANVLFDRNISAIFCTEDVVVLSELISASI